jgi:VCBS repeat-containing protein
VFAPGEVQKTITVDVADNTIYQLDRTVVFTLAIDASSIDRADLGSITTHTLTIEDNDGPTASLNPTTDTVEEADTTVQFTINLDQSIIAGDSPVLDLVIGAGTTVQEGVDFNIPESVQFNAGDNLQTVNVEILDNANDQPDRTLVLTLSPQEGSNINIPDGTSYTLTIEDDDETPVANDDTYGVNEDNGLRVGAPGVLDNDTDADGDTLTAAKLTDPTNGTLTFNSDGSFTYAPNENFFGTDSFTYNASDGANESGVAIVTITINPVNDAPVANDDMLTIVQNTTRPVNVLTNDMDVEGNTLSVDSVTQPANGTVAISADRQAINYTPNPNYIGSDTFEYTVCDNGAPPACATATVTVNVIEGKVYLPMIIGPGVPPPQAADLVVTDFRLEPNKTSFSAGESVTVIVEVTNQGNVALNQDFWVDFYINPEDIDANPVVPTVNQRWDQLCRDGAFTGTPCYYGIVWLVEDDLAPGESVTLRSTSISSVFSRWPGYFVNGTERLYVQVDSWNPGVSTGAVAEINEDNNLESILNITVSGSNPFVLADDLPTDIPPRPRP